MLIIGRRATQIIYHFLTNIHRGKKWLIPINVCTLLIDTLQSAKVQYEVIDIDKYTLCINQDIVIDKLIKHKDQLEGLLFVHSYGNLQDCLLFYKKIKEIKNDFWIIDDRSLCIPCLGKFESNYADMILYSTGRGKYIDFTMGGYAWCREELIFMKDLKICFNPTRYIELIEERKPARNKHALIIKNIYKNNIPAHLQFPERFQDWRFNISVDNKDQILKELHNHCLIANNEYAPLQTFKGDIIKTESMKLFNRIINLFHDFNISEKAAYKIVEIINRYC